MTITIPNEQVGADEHVGWCNPDRCFVVRPDRGHPHRRTVRHCRTAFLDDGSVIETYLITTQDPGEAAETLEFGVLGMPEDPSPHVAFDAWYAVVGEAMFAADAANRRPAVTR